MKKTFLSVALCLASIMPSFAVSTVAQTDDNSTDNKEITGKKKKSFVDKLPQPLRWLAKNWSDYDPRYSTPSFYNWAAQLQNTTSLEYLSINDGVFKMDIRSKVSNKLGPYFSYSFLGYGFGIDLNALKGTKQKNEFTLSINSNLMNIDIIRRRTGGDFMIKKFELIDDQETSQELSDITNLIHAGDYIKYGVTGFNINYFTNHRKYSNPAAFSNGAIQLRSAGSPIIGFGYTYQKLESNLSGAFLDYARQEGGYEEGWGSDMDIVHYALINGSYASTLLYYALPSYVSVNDLHLQLGYAQNIVFSKRLLLGFSVIASPSLKFTNVNNIGSLQYNHSEELASDINSLIVLAETMDFWEQHPDIDYDDPDLYEKYPELDEIANRTYVNGNEFQIERKAKHFGTNFFGRLSLTYNFNRWRAGFNANINAFLMKDDEMKFNNLYGSCNFYVGYCFGRKKEYRYDGKDRKAYIMAALTPKQIEEMNDTMPKGNLDKGKSYLEKEGKTKYHSDLINLNIYGCDLVKGPDGKYGTYEISDGLVTPGEDTEGLLKPGAVFDVDEDGDIKLWAGHSKSFRPANWWKSQLKLRQIPTNWYPEMLHYALKGKLTLWVRSHTFGTQDPVKVEINDFCVAHGKETKEFYQIGAKDFYSHSAYSIIGLANVNGRVCQVYIESRESGKRNDVYINRLKASSMKWMKNIPDDRPISRISLPGTHDAGTASLPENTPTSMGHTQNFTITEQLYDGLRAFDIRLKEDMKYGHTMKCRDGFDETLVDVRRFLELNPSEFIIAMIGSDEGGKWSDEMKANYKKLISEYSDLMVDDFDATTKISDVRGKILVIRRQEDCPYGKLLKFQDNTVFDYDCFRVEDVYKEHKTYKKIKIVENHLREAFENRDPNRWYITFNSIAWDPRHHKPYYSAWGAVNVRKPMNPSLREVIENKGYSNFGMVFLDFYNDHSDKPQLLESIINSNFHVGWETDYIPADSSDWKMEK